MLPGVAIPVAHLHHKDHIFEVICASLDLVTVGRAGFQFPKLCPEVFLQQAFSPEALGPRQTSDTVFFKHLLSVSTSKPNIRKTACYATGLGLLP